MDPHFNDFIKNNNQTAFFVQVASEKFATKDGKRHVKVVPVKLSRLQSNLRKKHVDSHFAMASVKRARELVSLFSKENVSFLCQDDKVYQCQRNKLPY